MRLFRCLLFVLLFMLTWLYVIRMSMDGSNKKGSCISQSDIHENFLFFLLCTWDVVAFAGYCTRKCTQKTIWTQKYTHKHTFRTNNRKTYKTLRKKRKKIWCGVPSSSMYKYNNNNNNKKGEEKIYNPIYKRKVNQLYLLCGFFCLGSRPVYPLSV